MSDLDLKTARAAIAAHDKANPPHEVLATALESVAALRAILAALDEADAVSYPSRRFNVGARVERVGHQGSPNQPGTLARFERSLAVRESMIVAFDDGETRAINPDVMRTVR
jgi:hypothetical protein